jgi:hypothetical protein
MNKNSLSFPLLFCDMVYFLKICCGMPKRLRAICFYGADGCCSEHDIVAKCASIILVIRDNRQHVNHELIICQNPELVYIFFEVLNRGKPIARQHPSNHIFMSSSIFCD